MSFLGDAQLREAVENELSMIHGSVDHSRLDAEVSMAQLGQGVLRVGGVSSGVPLVVDEVLEEWRLGAQQVRREIDGMVQASLKERSMALVSEIMERQ